MREECDARIKRFYPEIVAKSPDAARKASRTQHCRQTDKIICQHEILAKELYGNRDLPISVKLSSDVNEIHLKIKFRTHFLMY